LYPVRSGRRRTAVGGAVFPRSLPAPVENLPKFRVEHQLQLAGLGRLALNPTLAPRKLEGYANEDIAKELNLSTRTVVRKLARIRQKWDEGA